MTPEEFAFKVYYEGGLFSALFDYGLTENALDPEHQESDLYYAVSDFRGKWAEHMADGYETLSDTLYGLLESSGEEG